MAEAKARILAAIRDGAVDEVIMDFGTGNISPLTVPAAKVTSEWLDQRLEQITQMSVAKSRGILEIQGRTITVRPSRSVTSICRSPKVTAVTPPASTCLRNSENGSGCGAGARRER